jgi:hypothetical protein
MLQSIGTVRLGIGSLEYEENKSYIGLGPI